MAYEREEDVVSEREAWYRQGIACGTAVVHHAHVVKVLDDGDDIVQSRSMGSVHNIAVVGSTWFGYRVVTRREFHRILRARRKAARARGMVVVAPETID